jgi:hypothetical protein
VNQVPDVHLVQKKINPGNDLLSHSITCSTISAGGLNCRVRDGNGCDPSAIVTRKFYYFIMFYLLLPITFVYGPVRIQLCVSFLAIARHKRRFIASAIVTRKSLFSYLIDADCADFYDFRSL